MRQLAMTFSVLGALAFCARADQTREIERRIQTTPHQQIELTGLSGSDVEFKSWDKNEVYIKITVHVSSSDEEYEQEYINTLSFDEQQTSSLVTLRFKELRRGPGGSGFWSLFRGSTFLRKEILGEVFVPRSNAVTIDFSYGSISLDGMKGDLRILGKSNTLTLKDCSSIKHIENNYGKSFIERSGGELDLESVSSTVSIDQFAGPISIDANYSTISIKGTTRSASINSQSGKITLEDIGGDATIRADYSTLNVSQVKGFLDVTTKSGKLRVRDVRGIGIDAPYTLIEVSDVRGIDGKEVSVKGQSGSISLERINGHLAIESPYSSMSLKDIKGSVNLTNKSGRITALNVTGQWESRTEYSTLDLRGLSSTSIRIVNKSGFVKAEIIVVPTTMNIRNEYADVSVTLPKGFSGDIVLDAEYGKVDTNFPIRVKNKGSSGYGIGKVGDGTGSITVETKSGNIILSEK